MTHADLDSDVFHDDDGWMARRIVALQAQLATATHALANAQTQINLLDAEVSILEHLLAEESTP